MRDNRHLPAAHVLYGQRVAIVGGGPARLTLARLCHCLPHPSVVPDSDANTVDTNGKQHSHNLASRRKPHYPNWV
jgi:hypothetical protein